MISSVRLEALLLTPRLTSVAIWTSIRNLIFLFAKVTVQFLEPASLCTVIFSAPKTKRL